MRPSRKWFGLRGWRKARKRTQGDAQVLPAVLPDIGDALEAGTKLEEFVIERVLGAGGFGVTYLARDVSLQAWRAVKEYLPRGCGSRRHDGCVGPRSESDADDYQWGLEQFLEEARVLARFDSHRYIVRVFRVFEARGTAYLVMEYLDGRSLKEEIETNGALADDAVRTILLAITESLAAVHDAGLLHRDIKPDNVMLRPDGTPVLIDFGAARQMIGRSRSLRAVVSDGYAPIEQYSEQQERQGPWTDIYALGAVAYVALSGQVPDKAPDRVRTDPLGPVADAANRPVGTGLATAVDAALAVDEADRPRSVFQWRAMLDETFAPPRHSFPPETHPPPEERDAPVRDSDWDEAPRGATYTVGRAPECEVWLPDDSVSRNHAEVVRLADGRLCVTDRNSTNGTSILVAGEWQEIDREFLLPTDRIRFGHYVMTAHELGALCVRQEEAGSSGGAGKAVQDSSGWQAGASQTDDVDPRKGLVRDPKTGEILERERPGRT